MEMLASEDVAEEEEEVKVEGAPKNVSYLLE